MARSRPGRPPDPTAAARAREKLAAGQRAARGIKAPRVKHVPQVKAHTLPITVVRTEHALPKSSKKAVSVRIEGKMPKVSQVTPHHLELRTATVKGTRGKPSHTIVLGLAKMPKVSQVTPRKIPDVIG